MTTDKSKNEQELRHRIENNLEGVTAADCFGYKTFFASGDGFDIIASYGFNYKGTASMMLESMLWHDLMFGPRHLTEEKNDN